MGILKGKKKGGVPSAFNGLGFPSGGRGAATKGLKRRY